MLASEADEGPSPKPGGVSTMSSLMRRESVPNDDTSASRKMPGGIRFMGIVKKIGSGCRGCLSEAVRK